jgi:hypothetical protein
MNVGRLKARTKRADFPTELHIYAVGEHGFGVRKSRNLVSTWTERCVDWLHSQGMLKLVPAY